MSDSLKINNCRCYGSMDEEQNTWFVFDDTDEEFIWAEGFTSFKKAYDRIVTVYGKPPVEIMGV